MIPNINQNHLLKWLEQEKKDAHDAETFSRNGESTDFDSGIFKVRGEMADELIRIIGSGCKFEEVDGRWEPVVE